LLENEQKTKQIEQLELDVKVLTTKLKESHEKNSEQENAMNQTDSKSKDEAQKLQRKLHEI
jgi:hypothetical protein